MMRCSRTFRQRLKTPISRAKPRVVPAEIALNIGEPHNPYNKTLERILDDVSKGNPQMREWFRNNFEMPFDFAKGNYARGVATQFDEYFDAMKKSKIKLGSKGKRCGHVVRRGAEVAADRRR